MSASKDPYNYEAKMKEVWENTVQAIDKVAQKSKMSHDKKAGLARTFEIGAKIYLESTHLST